jgi:hypothetical protein
LIRLLCALGLPPAVVLEPLLPQAATTSAATIASTTAMLARTLLLVADKTTPSLSWQSPP